MPVSLLDANLLIALAWPEHEAHKKAGNWFAKHSKQGWATCPFTQAAFVRILSNPAFSPKALSPQNAVAVLEANLSLPGHHFWADNIALPEVFQSLGIRLLGHRQVTDAYLLALAIHNHGRLATFDVALRLMGGAVEVI
jgi:toxin-antitoxin system PIN domain toxin